MISYCTDLQYVKFDLLKTQLIAFRIQQGKHHTVIKAQYGVDGNEAIWDDRNPAWVDCDEDDDDPIMWARQQQDDINNDENILMGVTDTEIDAAILASRAKKDSRMAMGYY